jgi:hypothetical protein
MVLLQYLCGLFLSVIPARFLERVFSIYGLPKPRFYFSGRVAIYRLAQSLRKEASVVLLPDYICNVLYRSFTEAGFEILTYQTNNQFEPSLDEIRSLVSKANRPTVLCLAPIMGAEGGEDWITSTKGREWRDLNKVSLIFDCCQDISRLFSSRFVSEKNFAIVSSFNDKSFPGIMGAVTITDIPDLQYRLATKSEKKKINRLLLCKIYSYLRHRIASLTCESRAQLISGYDYSYCMDFPYTFRHSGATSTQVGIGVAGMFFRRLYMHRKLNYLKKKILEPVRTPYFLTSPFIMVDGEMQQPKLKIKAPYGIHGRPKESLRPLLKVYHFKGFMDTP